MKTCPLLFILSLLAACSQAPTTKTKAVVADGERNSATQDFIEPKRVPELQKIATKACLCERASKHGSETECWSDFWEIANEFRNSGEWASACGPGSSAGINFAHTSIASGSTDMTVMTEWGYAACSAAEVALKKAEYERRSKMRGC